jgi:hypothetical protein
MDTNTLTEDEKIAVKIQNTMLSRLEHGHLTTFNDNKKLYPTHNGLVDLRDHDIRVKGDTSVLDFSKCDFTYSSISGSFVGTNFSGSVFKFTDDSKATFKNCNFADCLIDFDTSINIAVTFLLEYDRLPHFEMDRRYAAGYLLSDAMWVSAGKRIDLDPTDRKDKPSRPYKYILENFSVKDVFVNTKGWGPYVYKNQVSPIE